MYRQPENTNRVRSMKSRFEDLNAPGCTKDDKLKKSPVLRNAVSSKPPIGKSKKIENNNNNDYNKSSENKRISSSSKENQSLKLDKMKPEENNSSRTRKDKYEEKSNVKKDFSDVNKKELCTVPPLNLTRQLNDPSKKGCIKRTPAFRKDKSVNSKTKTTEDLNFASIVKLFESNNDNTTTCDTVNASNVKNMTKSSSSDSDINKVSFVSKQSLTSTVSHTGNTNSAFKQKLASTVSLAEKSTISQLDYKQKISTIDSQGKFNSSQQKLSSTVLHTEKSSISQLESTYKQKLSSNVSIAEKSNKSQSSSIVSVVEKTNKSQLDSIYKQKLSSSVSNINNAIQNSKASVNSSVQKQKLTSSSSLVLESEMNKNKLISQLRQKSLSPQRTTNNHATLKISEKENHENKETKVTTILPAYAQVIKPKKPVVPTATPNSEICLTDTLKAALKQPLPTGPPPKKPPRTFAHTQITPSPNEKIDSTFCDKLNESLSIALQNKTPENDNKKPFKIKSDPKLMLQKLENALLSNKIRSPKLPRKLKPSLEACSSSKPLTNSNCEPNIYTTESPHKNLFPNCLPSLNCVSKTSASNTYAKVTPAKGNNSSMSTFFAECQAKTPEPIYAEPFQFKLQEDSPKSVRLSKISTASKADTLSNSLHYMSNPVCEWNQNHTQSENRVVADSEGETTANKGVSSKESESGPLTRHKLNLVMNHHYATPSPTDSDFDSLPSTPSSDGTPSSKRSTIKDLIINFEQKNQLEPISLQIPASVKQRLTVSPSWPLVDGNEDSHSPEREHTLEERRKYKTQLTRTLTEIRKTYVRKIRNTLKKKPSVKDDADNMFECCLLVGLNVANLTPYIKTKFPPDCEVPPWVEHLCFPDATEWSEKLSTASGTHSQDCQCYSLVITNSNGDRKFGYCRRVVPEETSVCLPLTYCIISRFRAAGFYHKVLKELESRHGLPAGLQEAFVNELHKSRFPLPGESVKVGCLLRSLVVNSCKEMVDNHQINSPENIECVKRIINMQNGAYEYLKSDRNSEQDWEVLKLESDSKSDFTIPKNTYGVSGNSTNETSFSKIHKYSKEFKRSNVNSSSENLSEILRVKPDASPQNPNTRNSDPHFTSTKRIGRLFDEITNLRGSNSDPVCSNFSESPLWNLSNSQLLHDCLLGDVVLKRPYDSRLEDVDLTVLFNTLDLTTMLQTFGTLLHERKVVFVSSCLSKLSSCVEALQSILYPFSWQHTFIPVLSNNMLEILSAPLPLIAGVLASHITETLIIEEGIAVNLDKSTVVCYKGDESDIIPKRLQKGLTVALQLVTEATDADDRSRNVLVSEAFIRMFVEACGKYKQFISANEDGQKVFERDSFIKHHETKSVNFFLDWFTETAMFNSFIQSRLDGEPSETMFEQRCVERNSEKNSAALLKNSKVTQKMKHLGQRLFH